MDLHQIFILVAVLAVLMARSRTRTWKSLYVDEQQNRLIAELEALRLRKELRLAHEALHRRDIQVSLHKTRIYTLKSQVDRLSDKAA